jgi:hypothetical protein
MAVELLHVRAQASRTRIAPHDTRGRRTPPPRQGTRQNDRRTRRPHPVPPTPGRRTLRRARVAWQRDLRPLPPRRRSASRLRRWPGRGSAPTVWRPRRRRRCRRRGRIRLAPANRIHRTSPRRRHRWTRQPPADRRGRWPAPARPPPMASRQRPATPRPRSASGARSPRRRSPRTRRTAGPASRSPRVASATPIRSTADPPGDRPSVPATRTRTRPGSPRPPDRHSRCRCRRSAPPWGPVRFRSATRRRDRPLGPRRRRPPLRTEPRRLDRPRRPCRRSHCRARRTPRRWAGRPRRT